MRAPNPFLAFIGGILVFSAILFFGVLAGTILGAVVGYVVGLFYDDTLRILAERLGLYQTPPWQLGAMLGFVASFFRGSPSKPS